MPHWASFLQEVIASALNETQVIPVMQYKITNVHCTTSTSCHRHQIHL